MLGTNDYSSIGLTSTTGIWRLDGRWGTGDYSSWHDYITPHISPNWINYQPIDIGFREFLLYNVPYGGDNTLFEYDRTHNKLWPITFNNTIINDVSGATDYNISADSPTRFFVAGQDGFYTATSTGPGDLSAVKKIADGTFTSAYTYCQPNDAIRPTQNHAIYGIGYRENDNTLWVYDFLHDKTSSFQLNDPIIMTKYFGGGKMAFGNQTLVYYSNVPGNIPHVNANVYRTWPIHPATPTAWPGTPVTMYSPQAQGPVNLTMVTTESFFLSVAMDKRVQTNLNLIDSLQVLVYYGNDLTTMKVATIEFDANLRSQLEDGGANCLIPISHNPDNSFTINNETTGQSYNFTPAQSIFQLGVRTIGKDGHISQPSYTSVYFDDQAPKPVPFFSVVSPQGSTQFSQVTLSNGTMASPATVETNATAYTIYFYYAKDPGGLPIFKGGPLISKYLISTAVQVGSLQTTINSSIDVAGINQPTYSYPVSYIKSGGKNVTSIRAVDLAGNISAPVQLQVYNFDASAKPTLPGTPEFTSTNPTTDVVSFRWKQSTVPAPLPASAISYNIQVLGFDPQWRPLNAQTYTRTAGQFLQSLSPGIYAVRLWASALGVSTESQYLQDANGAGPFVTGNGTNFSPPSNLKIVTSVPGSLEDHSTDGRPYQQLSKDQRIKLTWANPDIIPPGGISSYKIYRQKMVNNNWAGFTYLNTVDPDLLSTVVTPDADGVYMFFIATNANSGAQSYISMPTSQVAIDQYDFPTITSVTAPAAYVNGSQNPFGSLWSWAVTDEAAGIKTASLILYNASNISTEITANLAKTDLWHGAASIPVLKGVADGAYTWQITATDLAGHKSYYPDYKQNLTLDTTKPVITNFSPTLKLRPTFDISASDATSGLATATITVSRQLADGTYQITTSETIPLFGSTNYTDTYALQYTPGLSQGTYNFRLDVVDSAGNPASQGVIKTLANGLALSFKDGSLAPQFASPESMVSWSYQRDNLAIAPSEIKTMRYWLSNVAHPLSQDTITNMTLEVKDLLSISGTYALTFEVVDKVTPVSGIATTGVTVLYDNVQPNLENNAAFPTYTVGTISKGYGSIPGTATVTFIATAEDNFSGIQSVTMVATADAPPAEPDQIITDPDTGLKTLVKGQTYPALDWSRIIDNIDPTQNNLKHLPGLKFAAPLTLGYVCHCSITLIDIAGNVKTLNKDITVANPVYNQVANVTVSPASASLKPGQTVTLVATAFASDQTPLAYNTFIWSASPISGVLYNISGNHATFLASNESTYSQQQVRIQAALSEDSNTYAQSLVTIDKASVLTIDKVTIEALVPAATLVVGSTAEFQASAYAGDTNVTNASFNWSITPTVTSARFFTNAASNHAFFNPPSAGTYTLEADSSSVAAKLTVVAADYSGTVVKIDSTTPSQLAAGKQFAYSVGIYDLSGAAVAASKKPPITWSIVSGYGEAAITQAGVLTAPNKPGTFKIRAAISSTIYDEKIITVVPAEISDAVLSTKGNKLMFAGDSLKVFVFYVDQYKNICSTQEMDYTAQEINKNKVDVFMPAQSKGFKTKDYQISIYTLSKNAQPTLNLPTGIVKTGSSPLAITAGTFGIERFDSSFLSWRGLGGDPINGFTFTPPADDGTYMVSLLITPSVGYPRSTTGFITTSLPPRVDLVIDNKTYTMDTLPQDLFISNKAKVSLEAKDKNLVTALDYQFTIDAVPVQSTTAKEVLTAQEIQSFDLNLSSALASLPAGDHDINVRANATDGAGDTSIATFSLKVSDSARVIGEVLAAPNPAKTHPIFYLNVTADAPGCTVSVYDTTGQKVWTKKVDLTAGPNFITWDHATQPANGAYHGLLQIGSKISRWDFAIVN